MSGGSAETARKGLERWALPAILLLVALAYLPALDGAFTYDDRVEVVGNRALRAWSDPAAIAAYNPSRVITLLSFALDWAFWGFTPRGYHGTNLVLHGLNVWLAWRLARRLLDAPRALAVAALWGLHPMGSESVAYVAGRSEALCAAGILVALEAWLADRPWRALAGGIFALLCKEVALALPLVLAGLDLARGRPLPGRMLALAGGLGAAAVLTRLGWLGWPAGETDRGALGHLLGQGEAWGRYLQLWLLPWRQSVLHDVQPSPWGLLGGVGVTLAAGLAWKKGGSARAGALIAVGFLLPASALPLQEVMAEHRAYLSGLGILLAAVAAWPAAFHKQEGGPHPGDGRAPEARGEGASGPAGGAVLVGVLALALAGATGRRAWAWAEEARLWRDAVAANPESAAAHYALGDALRLARRHEEAEGAYRKALELRPGWVDARLNLGIVRAERGDRAGARELWAAILREDPRRCAAHNNLAALSLREGDSRAAVAGWQASLRACPEDLLAHLNLGQLHARAGDVARAAFHLDRFLERAPEEHPSRPAALAARSRLALSDGPVAPR